MRLHANHLIVTCCSQKRSDFLDCVHLHSFNHQTYEQLVDAWFDRLAESNRSTCKASDLYRGNYWLTVKDVAHNFDYIWILSAGYGLISFESKVSKYGATFVSGDADSIPRLDKMTTQKEANKRWWNLVNQHSGNNASVKQGVAELLSTYKPSSLVVCGSANYAELILDDLNLAIEKDSSFKDKVLLISSKQDSPNNVNHLRVDGKMRTFFASPMITLGLELLKHLIIESKGIVLSEFSSVYESIPLKKERYDRLKLSDEEIRNIIRQMLEEGSTKRTISALLKSFRLQGFACEQKRFSELTKQVL